MPATHDAREAELEILRRMTPEEKIAVMNGLIVQAVDLKEAWLRSHRPDVGEQERRREAWRLVTGGVG